MIASILQLNDKAVDAIQDGNFAKSNEILKAALRELKHMQQSEDEAKNAGHHHSAEIALVIDSVTSPGKSSGDGNSDTVFSFFNKGLIFREDKENPPTMESPSGQTTCAKVAMVVLYNLGLTFHLSAVSRGASKDLDTALAFYKNAMALAPMAGMMNRDVLPVLALVNNMGCIYSALVDYEGASSCLSMLIHFYEAADAASHLSDDNSVFFYLTTFVFPTWQLMAAPTA